MLFSNKTPQPLNNQSPQLDSNKTAPVQAAASQPLEAQTNTVAATPQANKVTLGSLLQGGNASNVPVVSSGGNKTLSTVQEQRFLSVKYKIYTLIIASALIILYGPLTSAVQVTMNKWKEGNDLTTKINQRIDDQKDYQVTTDFIKEIENNKAEVITCINQEVWCDNLPDTIKEKTETVKDYIQIGDLTKPKMAINESKILKSINEFITKSSLSWPDERKYNGTVTDISIGDNEILDNNIVQVPINLTITFNTQDNLIDFLNNLENRIFYDQVDGLNNSVLYKIQEIKYDIVNYKDSQDVEVSLYAYAYNK